MQSDESHPRRRSVKEAVAQLERNKEELKPPIFDSQKDIPKQSKANIEISPQSERRFSQNTIRYITMQSPTADTGMQKNGTEQTTGLDNEQTAENEQTDKVKTTDDLQNGHVTIKIAAGTDGTGVKIETNLEAEPSKEERIYENVDQTDSQENGNKTERNEEVRETVVDDDSEENKDIETTAETVQNSKPSEENAAEGEKSDDEKESETKTEKKEGDSSSESSGNEDEPLPPPKPMTEEEIEQLVNRFPVIDPDKKRMYLDFFWSVDTNRYGNFTIQQFARRLRKMGHKLYNFEIARIFADLNTHSDGVLTLEEYLSDMAKSDPAKRSEEETKHLFETFDIDRDGYISRTDLETAVAELGYTWVFREDLNKIMKADKSGRGSLSYEDFCKLIQRPPFFTP